MQYVSLFYDSDGCLVRTILTDNYDDAILACVMLAKDAGEHMDKECIKEYRGHTFSSGSSVHIGELAKILDNNMLEEYLRTS